MDKIAKNWLLGAGAVILLLAGYFIISGNATVVWSKLFSLNSPVSPEGIILFYGDGCPHCKLVDDFLSQNKIEEKVKFIKLEIPFNGKTSSALESNLRVLVEKANFCKVDTSAGVPIPFLWDGQSKCVLGDQDTIAFFKEKSGIK